jgi:cytochrome c oxidase subunit I
LSGAGNAPDVGWWAYAPLASRAFSPDHSSDYWTIAPLVSGFGSIGTAINIIATIISMRCPGMTLSRMPLLAWLNLVMSGMVLLAISPLLAAQIMLLVDRYLGGHFFDTQAGGSATLWMHFFWIFGHPEVYVLIIPGFAFASEIIPVFSRKPIFGYPVMVGGAVGGIVGIYLSVPLVAALRVIYRRFASPPLGATVPGSIVDSPESRGETSVMA